jgi:hypothetical protein
MCIVCDKNLDQRDKGKWNGDRKKVECDCPIVSMEGNIEKEIENRIVYTLALGS